MNKEPAFPNPRFSDVEGMTLRDYFAAHAVAGFVHLHPAAYEVNARMAYALADAMLEVREK